MFNLFILIFDMFVVSFDMFLLISYQSDLNFNFDQFDLNFGLIIYVLPLRPVRVYGNDGVFIFFTKSFLQVTAQGGFVRRCHTPCCLYLYLFSA